MMYEPLVSVIIPTYNRSEILSCTIKNVLSQTWENTQIIIIDDGESEITRKIIQSFNDSRINYNKTEKNLGCANARMLGVQFSDGDFITFLDDDDEWNLNYISDQLKVFKEKPSLDVVICNYKVHNKNGEINTHNMQPFTRNFKKMIHMGPGPFFQCCMFKHEILYNIEKLLDSHSIPSEDWDFFINLSMRNPSVGYSPTNGFKWNYSQFSQSNNLLLEAKSLDYIVQKHHKSIMQLCGRIILSDHYRRIARVYEHVEKFPLSKKFYIKAFFTAPWWWKNIFYIILFSFGQKIGSQIVFWGRKYRSKPNE